MRSTDAPGAPRRPISRLLDRLFAEHSDLLRWVRPAGGMTAFPWLTNGLDTREFCRSMARTGVLMAPGDCFGMPAHFRLGFAASGERFAQGIERVAEFLREIARPGARGLASYGSAD